MSERHSRGRSLAVALLTLCVVAPVSSGCMREREEPKTPPWLEQIHASASRRYSVRDVKGTRLFSVQRRGMTFAIDDDRGALLAKASLRRHKQRIVLRQPNGELAGHTQGEAEKIELRDRSDQLIASLTFDRHKKIVTLQDAQGVALRAFEIQGPDEVLSRRPTPPARDDEDATGSEHEAPDPAKTRAASEADDITELISVLKDGIAGSPRLAPDSTPKPKQTPTPTPTPGAFELLDVSIIQLPTSPPPGAEDATSTGSEAATTGDAAASPETPEEEAVKPDASGEPDAWIAKIRAEGKGTRVIVLSRSGGAGETTMTMEYGSELGALGLALLQVESLSWLQRLGFAVHVAELSDWNE